MKFLIIQTSFLGDVILATPVIEKLYYCYPYAKIDFLLRNGNESLFHGHPILSKVWVWNKIDGKLNLFTNLLPQLRKEKYDYVINLQRFLTTGLVTALSGGKKTIGYSKNPLSPFFSKRYSHDLSIKGSDFHEIDRNLSLLADITKDERRFFPKLYPSAKDYDRVKFHTPYVTIAPTSVWFTKQYPKKYWISLINLLSDDLTVFLLGAKSDWGICEEIKKEVNHKNVINEAGRLNLLASAALMKTAKMNYVNDSAPLHLASAMNAPVTAVFCSTIPAFGFGPLSENSKVVETHHDLKCKPCGLHGYKECPLGHFKCSDIDPMKVI